jgi:hypothetical protein
MIHFSPAVADAFIITWALIFALILTLFILWCISEALHAMVTLVERKLDQRRINKKWTKK